METGYALSGFAFVAVEDVVLEVELVEANEGGTFGNFDSGCFFSLAKSVFLMINSSRSMLQSNCWPHSSHRTKTVPSSFSESAVIGFHFDE